MKVIIVHLCLGLLFICCNKEDDAPVPTPPPPPAPTPLTPALYFDSLYFSYGSAFFSTDGSMKATVNANAAKLISSKIDITYIYNVDYSSAGFLDPKTRSMNWYWDDYYSPWLSNSIQSKFYATKLTKSNFDSAKADQSKISVYFSQPSVTPTLNSIFPEGSCIGGRSSTGWTPLVPNYVYGFKNVVSGKMGLLYIKGSQIIGWPVLAAGFGTMVEIIREK